MTSILSDVAHALEGAGVNVTVLGLAWARATPLVVLVPAFGLRALPSAARVVLALSFAVTIMPAAGVLAVPLYARTIPWPALVAGELLQGLPVALTTAVPLWAATMTGDLADVFRGGEPLRANLPVVEGQSSPLGALVSMLASAIWLNTGGPARAVAALAAPVDDQVLVRAAHVLIDGIALAVSLAAPVLIVSIVLEFALSLVTRAAAPAQISALLAPLRSVAILATTAFVLDRIVRVLATHLQ